MTINVAIEIMTSEIVRVVDEAAPSVYLYGSVATGDFRLGWSDIDILVLLQKEVTEQQAERLLLLRQFLVERYGGDAIFRSFEGAILASEAFLQGKCSRVVYWGTSGQRLTNTYKLSSFNMAELFESGVLLYGEDLRGAMRTPSFEQMREETLRHVQSARVHGDSVGWMLDIARGIYTLRTGKVLPKTAAGEWALKESLCPDAEILQRAIAIRNEPLKFEKSEWVVDNAVIQRFADVLEREISR
jgi:predicted nucleotidyltransferase